MDTLVSAPPVEPAPYDDVPRQADTSPEEARAILRDLALLRASMNPSESAVQMVREIREVG